MRSSKSRSRSKGNRNRSVGNIVNRVFDSSGPEGKVRGTPQQIIDKYNQLARDAQLSNDRVAAENFQQHAEHYLRMLSEAQREQQERQQGNPNQGNNDNNQNESQGGGQQNDQQSSDQQGGRDNDQQGDGRRGRNNRQQGGDNYRGQPQQDDRQPDVIDVAESDEGGLVETPEDKPQRPRRTRRKAEPQADAPQDQQPTPDAAE